MHLKSISYFALVLVIFACGEKHDHSDNEKTVYSIPDLELNNNALWKANTETTDGIFGMIGLMDSFSDKENVSAYNELAGSLNKEFNGIFKNCTMTGAAHDQLHNYLLPLKEIMEGLRSSELNICKASFADLEHHLGLYFEFFENEH